VIVEALRADISHFYQLSGGNIEYIGLLFSESEFVFTGGLFSHTSMGWNNVESVCNAVAKQPLPPQVNRLGNFDPACSANLGY
jgi:hypothetical protein